MIKSPLDSFGEWTDMSVFLEMKPRNEHAALFVDVPPGFREKTGEAESPEGRKTIKYNDINVVNVTDAYIRIGAPPTPEALMKREKEAATSLSSNGKKQRTMSGSAGGNGSLPNSPTKKCQKKGKKAEKPDFKATRYGATLRDVIINASTLCSPTFGDQAGRIFMCKVQIDPLETHGPLIQKTAHRLAVDVCKMEKLEEFAAKAFPRINCARCKLQILSEEYIMTIGCLPDDDFLATTQSADFYCRDSCGAGCDPDRHNHGKREELKANPKWLPDEKKVMISYANSIIHKSSAMEENIIIDEKKNIKCAGCKCQLGRVQKNHPDLLQFNHVAALMTSGPKKIPIVDKLNVPQLSIYMSQLVLNGCEEQASINLKMKELSDRNNHKDREDFEVKSKRSFDGPKESIFEDDRLRVETEQKETVRMQNNDARIEQIGPSDEDWAWFDYFLVQYEETRAVFPYRPIMETRATAVFYATRDRGPMPESIRPFVYDLNVELDPESVELYGVEGAIELLDIQLERHRDVGLFEVYRRGGDGDGAVHNQANGANGNHGDQNRNGNGH